MKAPWACRLGFALAAALLAWARPLAGLLAAHRKQIAFACQPAGRRGRQDMSAVAPPVDA